MPPTALLAGSLHGETEDHERQRQGSSSQSVLLVQTAFDTHYARDQSASRKT